MLMPSIFGESLFDDFMEDFIAPFCRAAENVKEKNDGDCGEKKECARQESGRGKGEPGRIARRNGRWDPYRPFFAAPSVSVMKTDIKESDTGFELEIDLPGFKKEDVKAELKDGYLTVTAKKDSSEEEKDEDGKYIRRERFYGTSSRSFYVGEDVTEEDIKGRFEEGILKLSVPKKEPKKEEEVKRLITIE